MYNYAPKKLVLTGWVAKVSIILKCNLILNFSRSLIGFFCGLSSPQIAKWVAPMGFDIVWIDWEYAAMNVETMTQVVLSPTFITIIQLMIP